MKLYQQSNLHFMPITANTTKPFLRVSQAFQAFDKESTGRIHVTDLRRLLDNFCFKMTNSQYKAFAATLPVNTESLVDYTAMLDNIRGPTNDMGVSVTYTARQDNIRSLCTMTPTLHYDSHRAL